MGIAEKIAQAKKTSWVTEGFSDAEVKSIVELAKISARIERCRIELGMTQKEFAEYMGVSQGMISKWESREYNFTIRTLNEICHKLNLTLEVFFERPCAKSEYRIVKWEDESSVSEDKRKSWCLKWKDKGAIA